MLKLQPFTGSSRPTSEQTSQFLAHLYLPVMHYMRFLLTLAPLAICLASAACSARPVRKTADAAADRSAAASPTTYHRMPNGLRVVLSRDATVPLVRVGVYYAVGPREEPQGRAGFAHLFEHLMFEGSEHLAPGEYFDLIVSSGGRFGARTLYDFTKYTATVPSNALEVVLWAEADRMRGLRFDQKRLDAVRATVKNEVRQQAFDRPYGRFVWIDIHELAQTRWENAHSIYGDTPDGLMTALDSASLDDAREFFKTYYTPDNAALVVYGDIDADETLAIVTRYFGGIPRGQGVPRADRTEPRQTSERRASRVDRNAPRPALAIAYHMPPRSSRSFWVMGIIDQILIEGRDAWMYESLVQRRGLTEAVYGGISPQHGSIYTTNGPNFWAVFVYHDRGQSPDSILVAMDEQIERIRSSPVDQETLRRAIAKERANFYAESNANRGEGRADMLGQFALFDDDPLRLDRFDAEIRSVTPEMVLETAKEYLRPTNRTVLKLETKAAP